ncbi:hypothetical protein D9M72_353880 [compost metagenome]
MPTKPIGQKCACSLNTLNTKHGDQQPGIDGFSRWCPPGGTESLWITDLIDPPGGTEDAPLIPPGGSMRALPVPPGGIRLVFS